MFTPEYLSELVEATDLAATKFNMYLTNKIIDSVISLFESEGKIKIIPTNQYRIQLLKQSGILVSDIEKEISKRFPGLDNQIREAFYQAGYEINEDINKSVSDMVDADEELKAFIGRAPRLENLTDEEKRILNAAYKRTNGKLENLTRTTASDMNVKFMNACDAAWWKAKHGISGSTAIKEAIDEVSKYGTCVVYKSGRKMSIEAAVRMCVLTGINQANSEITLQVCANLGINNVLVSSHLGARYTDKAEPANHMSWQGKVYSLSDELLQRCGHEGKEDEEKKKGTFSRVFAKIKEFFQRQKNQRNYDDFETVTGYGTIEGLSGINCRHTFQPFYPGMSNNQEQYDNEESKKAYDFLQKQRSMERKIRETKKRLFEMRHAIKTAGNEELISKLVEEESEMKAMFDKQNNAYTIFCKQNGLRRREDRLYVSDSKQIIPKRTFFSDILQGNKTRDFTKIAGEINQELDTICVRKSKWSGKIVVDNKIAGYGAKEWNCDIRLSHNADYATELHELLHARSISYYSDKIYKQYRKMEEGSVELLTEEICKRKRIEFISTYEEQVKHLRRINRRAKLYEDEYNFAVDLLNVPLVERSEWLIKRINDSYAVGILNEAEREGAFDSLIKILEEVH